MPPKFHDPYVLIIKMGRPSPSAQGEFGSANFIDLHNNRIICQTTGPHARAPSSLDSRRRDAVLKNRQRRPDKIVNSTCYQRNIALPGTGSMPCATRQRYENTRQIPFGKGHSVKFLTAKNLCRVFFVGHSAKTLPSAKNTRQK